MIWGKGHMEHPTLASRGRDEHTVRPDHMRSSLDSDHVIDLSRRSGLHTAVKRGRVLASAPRGRENTYGEILLWPFP